MNVRINLFAQKQELDKRPDFVVPEFWHELATSIKLRRWGAIAAGIAGITSGFHGAYLLMPPCNCWGLAWVWAGGIAFFCAVKAGLPRDHQ